MAKDNNLAVVEKMKVMKNLVNSESMKKRMEGVLGREAGTFLASVLDLYSSDSYLQQCDANKVMAECMKAAALKLPIAKSLGFAYIIPYKNVPQFQLGYKGILQLAQRTGQYKYINADVVYEGETVFHERLSGMVSITGERTSDKPIGYFAYFQLLNGFEKAVYWSEDRVRQHAKKFSQSYKAGKQDSPWFTNFEAMALKTVLKQLISKYGIMSVEFARVLDNDNAVDRVDAEVAANGNGEPVALPERPIEGELTEPKEPEGEPAEEAAEAIAEAMGVPEGEPDF